MSGISTARTRTKGTKGKTYLRVRKGKCRNDYVHTLVAEAMLGRELYSWECVDHRDGDGLNDKPWNLRVMTIIGNSRRKDQPPLKGEVVFDGAEWWAKNNPDWVDPLGEVKRDSGEEIQNCCAVPRERYPQQSSSEQVSALDSDPAQEERGWYPQSGQPLEGLEGVGHGNGCN